MREIDRRLMLSACAGAAVASQAQGAQPKACSSVMLATLGAPGPHIIPGESEQARIFDGVIGDWDVLYTFIDKDGSRQQAPGRFIADWVLEGRAVQDLWMGVPPGATENWVGTTVRFFVPEKKDLWRVTWMSPIANAVTELEGRREGSEIVLHGQGRDGALRWTFYDLKPDAFSWRGELSEDGARWILREQHRMTRKRRRNA